MLYTNHLFEKEMSSLWKSSCVVEVVVISDRNSRFLFDFS